MEMSNSSHCAEESSAAGGERTGDVADTASYLQVVVEKHRRAARLPTASSPAPRGLYVVPHGVVLSCDKPHVCYGCENPETRREGGAGEPSATPVTPPRLQKTHKSWNIFNDVSTDACDNEPARVEVYYFERGPSDYLATSEGTAPAACERAARRGARALRQVLAECLAGPQLLLALPALLLAPLLRTLLLAARGLTVGVIQTTSDYLVKPALALTFNAVLRPALVFAGNVAQATREAVRPLTLALGDAVEPAVRLLGAVRLVDVTLVCPHPHLHNPPV